MVYFFSPEYVDSSYGIRIGYEFVYQLRHVGIEAEILCNCPSGIPETPIPKRYASFTRLIGDEKVFVPADDDLMVYTDTVSGNPLRAKKVVRYLLNKPHYFGTGKVAYGTSDFVMAYSRLINPSIVQCFLQIDEIELFQQIRERHADREKEGVVVYFGKVQSSLVKDSSNFLKTLKTQFKTIKVCTRRYPAARVDLLNLIAGSELLISFDPLSNTNYEATLLGTPVLMMDDHYFKHGWEFNVPLFGFFYSFEQYAKAHSEVGEAWNVYKQQLGNEGSMIESVYRQIVDHFKRIESNDVQYIGDVRRQNLDYEVRDSEALSQDLQDGTLENIDVLKQIPASAFYALWSAYSGKQQWILRKYYSVQFLKDCLKKIGIFSPIKKIYRRIIPFHE